MKEGIKHEGVQGGELETPKGENVAGERLSGVAGASKGSGGAGAGSEGLKGFGASKGSGGLGVRSEGMKGLGASEGSGDVGAGSEATKGFGAGSGGTKRAAAGNWGSAGFTPAGGGSGGFGAAGEGVREKVFTRYQVFVIVIVSLLQFTVILDFIVMAPLGAELIRILKISPAQFGWVVSAYAFSAGIAGILAAGFADRFDRKKMLLFFYVGFIGGTLLCGIAPGYHFLLAARVVTGLFGGVLFSINMAIVADLFPLETRGRVMGFVQMAFAVSQVAGIPVGLYLAGRYGWHMPFVLIAGIGVPVGLVIWRWMKPIDMHLKNRAARRPLVHLLRTASQMRYLKAFVATALLSTGGFLMMPYSSAFLVHNVGVDEKVLPIVFMVAGFVGLFTGPLIGRLSDRIGKFRMFIAGSALASLIVPILSHLSISPLWEVLILNTAMYTAVFSRLIPSQALISGVPDAMDRGAFMSINSSVQQLGGGIASALGGLVIGQSAEGLLVHYDILGWVTVGAFFVCAVMMYAVNSYIMSKTATKETLSFS